MPVSSEDFAHVQELLDAVDAEQETLDRTVDEDSEGGAEREQRHQDVTKATHAVVLDYLSAVDDD